MFNVHPPPAPGTITLRCLLCGAPFEAETDPEVERLFGRRLTATVCDTCAGRDAMARELDRRAQERARTLPPRERRRRRWIAMVGTRYAEFHAEHLPAAIQPHAERVLAWTPRAQGIGLMGPPRTGKSPLLFALGQRLHLAGHDVFPTSGIAFQRAVHRSVEDRATWERYLARCEESTILLLDDADKLNLTPGVEAEYYGMLEHRRNWQRPVLATLNLCGEELRGLARERHDRASAIVERLRDLCEFVAVS